MTGRVGGGATYRIATCRAFEELPPPRGEPFVIGVVDTGVVVTDGAPHPFLRGHLTDGWQDNVDSLPTDGRPLGPHDAHGTFVAGLILNHARQAMVHMSNVLDEAVPDSGQDEGVARTLRGLIGVPYLKLVNLSFFGDEDAERHEPTAIGQALHDLFEAHPELIVVAAAGNYGNTEPVYPAAFNARFDGMLAIGAVDRTVLLRPGGVPPRASFSNHGPWVDGYASGVDVLGPSCRYTELSGVDDAHPPQTFTGWNLWSGTSFAAATVTGLLGRAMLDGATAAQARAALFDGPPLHGETGPYLSSRR